MRRPAPLPLTREIDVSALTCSDPCDNIVILGSFWPYATHSYESCVVKSFKEAYPVEDFQPGIKLLCEVYAREILQRLPRGRFEWVARAMGSSELAPEPERPLALLESVLCRELAARSLTHVFFRSEPRPAMRMVGQLSGPDALLRRLRCASQDLFVVPERAGGRLLLLDDIYNTGATMRLYSQALKQFAGVERVTGANLAATRFRAGKDGHGQLRLDTSEFEPRPEFCVAWLDSERVFHVREDCPCLTGKAAAKLRFVAERIGTQCRFCLPNKAPKKRFWGLFR